MAINVSTWVWKNSPHKGSTLLLLLAIADNAHDDGGGAYPSLKTLSAKTRMSERTVRYALRQLEQSGAILCDYKAGPNGVNVYSVVIKDTPGKDCPRQNDGDTRQNAPMGGQGLPVDPAIAIAPKPSLTVIKEPPLEPPIPAAAQISERPKTLAKVEFATSLTRLYKRYYPTVKPPGPGVMDTFRDAASNLALPLARETEIMDYCFQQAALALKPPRYALAILMTLGAEGWPDLSHRANQNEGRRNAQADKGRLPKPDWTAIRQEHERRYADAP